MALWRFGRKGASHALIAWAGSRQEGNRLMKVKNWMRKDPVTVERDASVRVALGLMEGRAIRHLPVVDGDGTLDGFVTRNDLRRAAMAGAGEDERVGRVMVLNPVTVNVNASIEHAARLVHEFGISGLPVLDRKKLVGIITVSDILSAFIEVMGLMKDSVRIDVVAASGSGIGELVRTVKAHGCEIMSIASASHSSRKRVYFFRLARGCGIEAIAAALEAGGHKVVAAMD